MIGILDSGLRGLDLVRRLTTRLPRQRFIYWGDTANGPYDEKSPETILRFALRGARILEKKGVRRIVVACPAVSGAAGPALTAASAVPVTDGIGPAAAAAVRISPGRRIGIIGGRAAILSNAYASAIRAIASEAAVYQAACPLIGALIEEGWLKKPELAMIIKKYLIPLKARKIDTLILGDSRFALAAKVIQRKIGHRVHLVDPSAEIAASLSAQIDGDESRNVPDGSGVSGVSYDESDKNGIDPQSPSRSAGRGIGSLSNQTEFYLSDVTPETARSAAVFLGRRVQFRMIDL